MTAVTQPSSTTTPKSATTKPTSPTSSRRSRRSRSPENRQPTSPQSVRRRSQDTDPAASRRKLDLRPPPYLRTEGLTLEDKFKRLDILQNQRLLASQTPDSQWWLETDSQVKNRNRYINIQAWAKNRIHLKVPDNHNDYVNASPIVLRGTKNSKEHHYIASQGPKQDHFSQFWRMVWHETGANGAVIVMLTRTVEQGREKCLQYFPDSLDSPILATPDNEFPDDFTPSVELVSMHQHASSRTTVRELRLTVNSVSKPIWHLFFAAWPDFTVPDAPDDRAALLELIKLAEEKATATRTPATPDPAPRIVHCSAGVGRSGTFIVLDYLLQELAAGALLHNPPGASSSSDSSSTATGDPVFDAVDEMRKQRMWMVQSEAQLGFIYQILLEQWNARYLGGGGGEAGSAEEKARCRSSGAGSAASSVSGAAQAKKEKKARDAQIAALAQEANAEMTANMIRMEN